MTDRSAVKSVCIVIPTYNEAENIELIIRQLLGVFEQDRPVRCHILVVDDRSPDGTGELVARVAREDSRVTLLSGDKQGLGSAYTRGFNHVLEHLDVDAVVQMDADLSHAPTDVPRLLVALDTADVAVGSRYVAGGGIDAAWSWQRRALSRGGNLFARYVAGIHGTADCTAGFKAIRTSMLRRVLPLRLAVQGYVFQVASLHALSIAGAQVVEIPIHFRDRSAGVTKLGMADIVEFFLHVWWLRLLSRKTFVKFAITGGSGVVVNLGVFQLLVHQGLNDYLCSAIAIETSIVWNFLWNNYWTFRDRTITSRKRIRGLKFNAVSLVTLGISFSTFVLLRWLMPEAAPWTAQFLSIFPGVFANYFANSYWTFKEDAV